MVAPGLAGREEERLHILHKVVQIGNPYVFLLKHQGAGKNQVGAFSRIGQEGIHHHFERDRCERPPDGVAVRCLVDHIGPVYPDHPHRGIAGFEDAATDDRLQEPAPRLVFGVSGPVEVEVPQRMQMIVAPASRAADMARKKGKRVNEANILAAKPVALQAGAHNGRRGAVITVPARDPLKVPVRHPAAGDQLVHRITDDDFPKELPVVGVGQDRVADPAGGNEPVQDRCCQKAVRSRTDADPIIGKRGVAIAAGGDRQDSCPLPPRLVNQRRGVDRTAREIPAPVHQAPGVEEIGRVMVPAGAEISHIGHITCRVTERAAHLARPQPSKKELARLFQRPLDGLTMKMEQRCRLRPDLLDLLSTKLQRLIPAYGLPAASPTPEGLGDPMWTAQSFDKTSDLVAGEPRGHGMGRIPPDGDFTLSVPGNHEGTSVRAVEGTGGDFRPG